MAVIRVVLHGFLNTFTELGRVVNVDIQDGWCVRHVLDALSIQPDIIGVVLVNKVLVSKDTPVTEHDRIDLYPLFGGG